MTEYINAKYKLTPDQEKVCYGLWKNFIQLVDRLKVGEKIGVATLEGKYWLELKTKEKFEGGEDGETKNRAAKKV